MPIRLARAVATRQAQIAFSGSWPIPRSVATDTAARRSASRTRSLPMPLLISDEPQHATPPYWRPDQRIGRPTDSPPWVTARCLPGPSTRRAQDPNLNLDEARRGERGQGGPAMSTRKGTIQVNGAERDRRRSAAMAPTDQATMTHVVSRDGTQIAYWTSGE